MNSIGGEECTELKKQYDTCFNSWFTDKFLKGKTDDSMCAPLFKVYQQCVKEAIKVHNLDITEIETNHLDTEREQKPASPKQPKSR